MVLSWLFPTGKRAWCFQCFSILTMHFFLNLWKLTSNEAIIQSKVEEGIIFLKLLNPPYLFQLPLVSVFSDGSNTLVEPHKPQLFLVSSILEPFKQLYWLQNLNFLPVLYHDFQFSQHCSFAETLGYGQTWEWMSPRSKCQQPEQHCNFLFTNF